jgi:hypothetical protein
MRLIDLLNWSRLFWLTSLRPPAGPDFALGVLLADFTGQTLSGHVGDKEEVSPSTRSAATIMGRSLRDWLLARYHPLPMASRLF